MKPWWSVWAKTGRDELDHRIVTEWLPLHQHLGDTAAIAGRLVDEWIPSSVLTRLSEMLGLGVTELRQLIVWAAAVHDVGKASPAFAVQCAALADVMREHGLAADPRYANDRDRSRIRHEMVGQVAVLDWLTTELRVPRSSASQLSCLIGGHHGVPPERPDLMAVEQHAELAGRGSWSEARVDVLRWAADLVGGTEWLAGAASRPIPRPAQVLLTAMVIVADWIASSELFDLEPIHAAREGVVPPNRETTEARAARAWQELDLPPRWRPQPITDVASAFQERFGRTPRPVQVAAVEAALAQETPGMVIVEAPMGEGKTEAALLAVEALAARSGADGCFVALPTRATTDAMFGRVLSWLQALPGVPVNVSVQLAHGTASLNDTFRGLLRRGHVRDAGECGSDVGVAHQWLRGRKRGVLAQFVIGTVDQVLAAALKSRHLVLRHLALAGKVVVIDEVHAYDVYMSQYLDRTLHWLGAYGTPVVLLSATLPPRRRAELVAAYESGRSETTDEVTISDAYPVVTATGLPPRAVAASGEPRTVMVERLDPGEDGDDLDELVSLLRDRLGEGGCAVVVRNTVARVQEAADRLIEEFGDDHVTVAHSRFLACDRAALDADLIRRFGPPTSESERPDLHIVVASQVVEQSLDVDFDLMVTDLAPVDLVLQRMGRLHRHRRVRPPRLTRPCCVLTGVESWRSEPVFPVAGSRRVYGEHMLLRAAALLADRDRLVLPDDIAPLVRAGYGDETIGPDSWQAAMTAAAEDDRQRSERRRANAKTFRIDQVGGLKDTLHGWIRAGVGDADVDDPRQIGQVRDGAESLEVLVVQRDADGGLLTPDWIAQNASVQIPLDDELPGWLARTVAACALRLPLAMSQPGPIGDGVIAALERNHFTSFDRTPLLNGQLVLVLDENRTAELSAGPATFRVMYDPRRGLIHDAC
ncbi:CRISPR-associated helicase, Cas3 family [Pseudonocardia thermophila]|uniref:CRISPR-associated helicase, Cas3 family n=1 Tax=Pseudonocardia thermophila TaxID=1848 RepID=A0A1M6YSW3_PSETH|nr:CRISPR-associated helicase, Cas3 family [Pseudonocardia thermophila]